MTLARVCEACAKVAAVRNALDAPHGWLRLTIRDHAGSAADSAEVCSWACAHAFVGDRVADELRRREGAA